MCTILSQVNLAYNFSSELGLCPQTEQEDGFFHSLSLPWLVMHDLIRTECGCGGENTTKYFGKQTERSWELGLKERSFK